VLARGKQFAAGSALEGGGFDRSLSGFPRSEPVARKLASDVRTAVPLRRDRWFESTSLQR